MYIICNLINNMIVVKQRLTLTHAGHRNCELAAETGSSMQFAEKEI